MRFGRKSAALVRAVLLKGTDWLFRFAMALDRGANLDRRMLPSAHTRQPGKAVLQPFEHQLAAIAVLHIGAGDRYGQDQTQYIDHDMPLTTLGALRSIVAPIAPFCCVATLWLSTIAALGQICRPLLTRT